MDPAEPGFLVLGTAGHIDHGKTALVAALTGVDTDRLPEEKARGITIDLGFAPLDLPGGLRLGVVDVPGHEALVRTMVAGATGIDLVLLVVAADEGVMPQTREHLAICELLGIGRGAVALTKVDAASDELAELAEAELRDELAGTALADAPLVRCSALTGEGVEGLRTVLHELALAARPRTSRSGPPRLSVDRAFAARGFGAVATGTLVGGELAVGDAVEIAPAGLRARVRGLQRHGEACQRVAPGTRCAVNLQGVELSDLRRGQLVTHPGALVLARSFDARVRWLAVAPATAGPVSVELLMGTAERRARVAPIAAQRLEPGGVGFARLHLEGEPLPALPGERFVLRGFARTAMGGTTLGGGVVLDAAPPRRRRSDPDLRRDLEALVDPEPEVAVRVRVRRAGLAGVAREQLRRETGLTDDTLDATLESLREQGAAATAADAWLAGESLADLERRLEAALDAYHAAEPLQSGMPVGALRGSLPENAAEGAGALALTRLVEAGSAVLEADRVRRPAHRPQLDREETTLVERILAEARAAGLEPPGLREWAEQLGREPARLRELLAHLAREGQLVRAGADLWFDRAAVDELRDRVVAHLRQHGRLDTPDYKALIGTTRRTAVPLMELFDDERTTLRRGSTRLLRPSNESG